MSNDSDARPDAHSGHDGLSQEPVIRPLIPQDQQAFLDDKISASQYLDAAYERELSIARLDIRRSLVSGRYSGSYGRSKSDLQTDLELVSARVSARVSELFLTSAAVIAGALLIGVVAILLTGGANAVPLALGAGVITCIAAVVIGLIARGGSGKF